MDVIDVEFIRHAATVAVVLVSVGCYACGFVVGAIGGR